MHLAVKLFGMAIIACSCESYMNSVRSHHISIPFQILIPILFNVSSQNTLLIICIELNIHLISKAIASTTW